MDAGVASDREQTSPPIAPEVAGRQREMAAALGVLAVARAAPATLVIGGAAGVGKTTVWRAVLEAARLDGFRTLIARPVEADTKLAFAGLVDLFEFVPERILGQLPALQAGALRVALRRERPGGIPADTLTVALAVLGAFRSLAGEGPVVVGIDDVQWLDAPTASVLQFVARRLTTGPIGLVMTERTTVTHPVPTVARGTSTAKAVDLEVAPLDVDALGDVLRARLGLGFLRPTLLRIHAASGGNAFYAIEIGAGLLRRGIRFAPEVLPIPDSLSDIVRDRCASLSETAQEACLVAALLGQPTVAGIRRGLTSDVDTEAGIAEAVRAGILERRGDDIRFGHPLLASITAETAGSERRGSAHRRLARVSKDPEERARHLALASQRRSRYVAQALDQAADHARKRGASESAAELSELALRRTPVNRPDDGRRRAILTAEHLIRAGDPDHARQLLDGILAGTETGTPRAEVLVALAESHSSGDWEVRVRLLEEALAERPEGTARIEAERLLGGAAIVMVRDLGSALAHARTAVCLAEDLGNPVEIAISRAMACRVEAMATGRVDRESLQRAMTFEPALATVHVVARPRFAMVTLVHLRMGEFDEARRHLVGLRGEAIRIGDWDAMPPILAELAEIDLRAGAWSSALALAREAELITRNVGQPGMRAQVLNALGRVLAHQGHLEEARAAAEEGAEAGLQAHGTANPLISGMILGLIELSVGNAAAAHRAMAPLVELWRDAGARDPEAFRMISDDVEALGLEGSWSDADGVLGHFEEAIATNGTAGTKAIAMRCRAMILAAGGDTSAAIDLLRAALELHEAAGEPFAAARSLLMLGEVERRDRRIGAARRSLTKAREQFTSLGAGPWAMKADHSLSRLAGRRHRQGLTETDRQIVDLVADGRTNRQVADALFMSPHTVDSHLRRIYRLLNVGSRTELTRWVASNDAWLAADDPTLR